MRAAAFFFFFFFFFNFFGGGGGGRGGGRVGMEIWRVSDKRTICFRRSMPVTLVYLMIDISHLICDCQNWLSISNSETNEYHTYWSIT